MKKSELLTWRDKFGIVLASLGIMSIMVAVMALISWPFLPAVLRNVSMLVSVELVFISSGAILIKLSLLTTKKSPDNSQ